MRSRVGGVLVVFLVLFLVDGYAKDNKEKGGKQSVTFSVPMNCKVCQNKVEKNIAFEKGVTDLKTDLPSNTVTVTFRTDKNTIEGLIAAFKKIGFEATVVKKG